MVFNSTNYGNAITMNINIGGIRFSQSRIPYNKSLSQFASSLTNANAINLASIVELAIIICFLDFQQLAPLPMVKI